MIPAASEGETVLQDAYGSGPRAGWAPAGSPQPLELCTGTRARPWDTDLWAASVSALGLRAPQRVNAPVPAAPPKLGLSGRAPRGRWPTAPSAGPRLASPPRPPILPCYPPSVSSRTLATDHCFSLFLSPPPLPFFLLFLQLFPAPYPALLAPQQLPAPGSPNKPQPGRTPDCAKQA